MAMPETWAIACRTCVETVPVQCHVLCSNPPPLFHVSFKVWGIYNHLHCNILMVEYRGYGLSTGVPSERGLVTDARAAIDYLHTRHDLDHTQLILFGRSLGGAVVIDVAADTVYGQKLMCAIVENTFTSIREMAVELVHPSVKYIPNLLYKNKVSQRVGHVYVDQ